ncbi:uncharacterized protein LOC115874419 [Sitophilus oryzae]|uniref:Uncharacterized protein LOC115874419 n=1 Tax=Sitophilus oryzae TaxID=7048 RepID=A0A6J2X2L8_SITOR|nr:uncharacterized protein LOC115874419 [Sitophilus oryzae]
MIFCFSTIYLFLKAYVHIFLILCLFLIVAELSIIILNNGQKSEDQWELFHFKLYDLPWYTWSKDNCRTLLMMITESAKVEKIVIINELACNHALFVAVWKLGYTVINAIVSLSKN